MKAMPKIRASQAVGKYHLLNLSRLSGLCIVWLGHTGTERGCSIDTFWGRSGKYWNAVYILFENTAQKARRFATTADTLSPRKTMRVQLLHHHHVSQWKQFGNRHLSMTKLTNYMTSSVHSRYHLVLLIHRLLVHMHRQCIVLSKAADLKAQPVVLLGRGQTTMLILLSRDVSPLLKWQCIVNCHLF